MIAVCINSYLLDWQLVESMLNIDLDFLHICSTLDLAEHHLFKHMLKMKLSMILILNIRAKRSTARSLYSEHMCNAGSTRSRISSTAAEA